jgi:hypothetical protein
MYNYKKSWLFQIDKPKKKVNKKYGFLFFTLLKEIDISIN